MPAAGTVEWARAVNIGWAEFQDAENARQVVERSQKLLALYGECSACQQQVNAIRDARLKRRDGDEVLLHQVQEAEFVDAPVSLGRLFLETGRPAAARDLATRELRRTRFLEQRLDLLEILGGAENALGHKQISRQLARRLLQETPVSAWYCDKALLWMTWLGEDPVVDPASIARRDFLQVFERIRGLEQGRGNDAYVSCVMSHALQKWDWFISSKAQVDASVDPDVLALFPEGIATPLEDLARRTSAPAVRAAILLQAARRWITRNDRPHLAGLIEEALQAGSAPNIQSGALVQKAYNMPFNAKREREALALHLIDRFPDSEAAVAGCYEYWTILGYQQSDFPSRIPGWKRKCLGLFQRSPDRVARWGKLITSMTPDSECAVEVYHALQAMKLPSAMAPMVLLRLSTALREEDPVQAWDLERQAVHHPEFPGLGGLLYWSFFTLKETLSRAEKHGDQGTVEYLKELFNRPGVRINE